MLDKNRFYPSLDSYPVNDTIKQIVEILNEQAFMQEVKIRLTPLPEEVNLELDLLRMQQVMINLLSNALKFSKPFDVINIRLKLTDLSVLSEVELQIEVADKGIGISEEE